MAALALGSCAKTRPAVAFDGKQAFAWVGRQVAFGPRAPGTAAHDSCFSFLLATLRQAAPIATADTFDYYVPELKKTVRLMNARARFRPEAKQRVVLAAHWDTRPWADRDPDPALRGRPIPGANDGGSGVAVLLEVAATLKRHAPALGVDIVLFDGEDLGTEQNPSGFFRGSNRYVVTTSGEPPPLFAIVIDMVGGRDAYFYWEGNSEDRASNIVSLVWNRARSLGQRRFLSGVKHTIYDDHIAFLNAGIPAIDIIDFDFPEWHTLKDDLSCVSPEPLESVGLVLLSLVTDPDFLGD
ncbi:MAG TPA: M28 family peptidase [Candidatus Eisenbacteria bacterium]